MKSPDDTELEIKIKVKTSNAKQTNFSCPAGQRSIRTRKIEVHLVPDARWQTYGCLTSHLEDKNHLRSVFG